MHPKNISIKDFTYELPNEKIALHPMQERDASKLLIFDKGEIQQDQYKNIASYIPKDSFLVFNNTRVINARLLFTKETGGVIEIFLLEPFHAEYAETLAATKTCKWKCLVGGVSKWKGGWIEIRNKELEIRNKEVENAGRRVFLGLRARLAEKLSDAYVVEFEWDGGISFAELLEDLGNIPLPPYIKRKPDAEDKERYQTIYAAHDGSVAAPTAGLHFTDEVFKSLEVKNISRNFVTLHVGAGTFKPVKAATMQEHEMHTEWIEISQDFIVNLIKNLQNNIIAVGTTSLRTLESLYWLGLKTILNPEIKSLQISQWEVYEKPIVDATFSAKEALSALINWMQKNKQTHLFAQTQILIAPGYRFRMVNALVTNFHQPQSTLLLLVAAAIGADWKKVYDYAMKKDFRFLSYGDGSLLFLGERETNQLF